MDKKSKNFETTVPENYVLVKHVNAKNDKKMMVIYTALSFVPIAIMLPLLYMVASCFSNFDISEVSRNEVNISVVLFSVVMIGYIILHEIIHGITYKYLTGAKLTFGLTLTVAFCGVPEIYVRKKASIAALLMPFLVFNVVFIALTVGLWFVSPLWGILFGAAFSIHLGGCVGDLHWALMYLTKYKRCNTLMRDTGPEQWLYIPKSEAEKYNITYELER